MNRKQLAALMLALVGLLGSLGYARAVEVECDSI